MSKGGGGASPVFGVRVDSRPPTVQVHKQGAACLTIIMLRLRIDNACVLLTRCALFGAYLLATVRPPTCNKKIFPNLSRLGSIPPYHATLQLSMIICQVRVVMSKVTLRFPPPRCISTGQQHVHDYSAINLLRHDMCGSVKFVLDVRDVSVPPTVLVYKQWATFS